MRLITTPTRTVTSDRLRAHVTRLQTVSDEHFEPIHRIFRKRLSMLDTAFLLFSMTVTGNCINRTVTPRRTGRIRCSMSGTLARRNRKIRHCVQGWPHGMAWCRRHRRHR
ncbi:MAG: hypothetical protein E5299_00500 [Burkholderia gladioli]|nr:MAG: hypothetical protein E5299_00500 [Burkholderia gladioli]